MRTKRRASTCSCGSARRSDCSSTSPSSSTSTSIGRGPWRGPPAARPSSRSTALQASSSASGSSAVSMRRHALRKSRLVEDLADGIGVVRRRAREHAARRARAARRPPPAGARAGRRRSSRARGSRCASARSLTRRPASMTAPVTRALLVAAASDGRPARCRRSAARRAGRGRRRRCGAERAVAARHAAGGGPRRRRRGRDGVGARVAVLHGGRPEAAAVRAGLAAFAFVAVEDACTSAAVELRLSREMEHVSLGEVVDADRDGRKDDLGSRRARERPRAACRRRSCASRPTRTAASRSRRRSSPIRSPPRSAAARRGPSSGTGVPVDPRLRQGHQGARAAHPGDVLAGDRSGLLPELHAHDVLALRPRAVGLQALPHEAPQDPAADLRVSRRARRARARPRRRRRRRAAGSAARAWPP